MDDIPSNQVIFFAINVSKNNALFVLFFFLPRTFTKLIKKKIFYR